MKLSFRKVTFFVISLKYYSFKEIGHPSDSGDPLWIGLSYNIKEKNFTWTDNTPFDCSYWGKNQPNITNNQYCVAYYDTWETYLCNQTWNFICKKPAE